MKVIFFEVQDWERDSLKQQFPDAIVTDEKLSIENVSAYKDCELASCFIYSHFNKEVIDQLPNLKFIATRSTGFDHIDTEYCKTKQVVVSNVPEYGSRTVAEHTFALILTLTRNIYQSINQAKQFEFDHTNIRGIDIYGKTIGIVGLGKIGMNVMQIAKGFGMKVLAYNRTQKPELESQFGFQYAGLDLLLHQSDIITLHLPYNEETHHVINKETIMKMKKGSFLINTARGGLIDTEAILLALNSGVLAGIGLDVVEEEQELEEEVAILTTDYHQKVDLRTLILNHVLLNHPKVVITPHNAFNSREALMRILTTTIENIHAYMGNQPVNQV